MKGINAVALNNHFGYADVDSMPSWYKIDIVTSNVTPTSIDTWMATSLE